MEFSSGNVGLIVMFLWGCGLVGYVMEAQWRGYCDGGRWHG